MIRKAIYTDGLTAPVDELRHQLEWLKRQMFGSKSERRIDLADDRQLALGESFAHGSTAPAPAITIPSHTRKPAQPPWTGTSDGRLRFDPSVPVREIHVHNPDTDLYPPDSYDIVGQKVTIGWVKSPAPTWS